VKKPTSFDLRPALRPGSSGRWHNRQVSQPPREGPWLGDVQTPQPEPRRPTVAIALAVVALLVVGLAVGALLLNAFGPTPSPTPLAASPAPTIGLTPSPGTAQSPPTATVDPSPPTEETPPPATPGPDETPTVGRPPPSDIAAQIDQVVADVPPIRQLEPLREVPYLLLSRDEFQRELEEMLAEEVDAGDLAIEGRLLQRLGLLPDDVDLYELLVALYGSQVAAYYRPDTSTFYIIERDEPFAAMDRMIVAHEYTHALQDQHYDLEGTRITDPSEGDAALAQLAAIEGDATLLMFQWALETLSTREQLELFSSFVPTPTDQQLLDEMPPILRRQLEFPYNDGFLFTTEVQRRGGWSAVDDTLANPPVSTEQVLHPDKYFAGEQPITVTVPDLTEALGAGWRDLYQQTMGELNIQVWLADGEPPPMVIPGIQVEPTPWQAAAAGWGGDRLHMYEDGAGGWAIVWLIEWDSEADADAFEAYVREGGLLGALDGVPDLNRNDGRTLQLVIANDQPQLEIVLAALAG
jgi:hypothetical protein